MKFSAHIFFAISAFSAFIIIVYPFFVHAVAPDPVPFNIILGHIFDFLEILIKICFTLALIVFGWGIVKFIAYAGDPQKIKDAKKMLIWGVIGIFVLASLYGIINFIQNYLGITNSNPPIIVPKFITGKG